MFKNNKVEYNIYLHSKKHMKLLIVESPAKCKKIESYLGKDYKCVASYGHITELSSLSQINIKNNFSPSFIHAKEKSKQIKLLQKETKAASEVILATDDDREGEAIAWHICNICKLCVKKTKRIIFHEITKTAILHAVENPTYINMNVVQAQHARQILDLCVGYTVSPVLWKYIEHGLSAGRCQTPALHLIYENENINREEIITYDIKGYFTSKFIPFALRESMDDPSDFLEKCKTHSFMIHISKPKEIKKSPPKPFITSTLQQKANQVYHYSPKQTMTLCQKLYEQGYITYMRTDSSSYSKVFIKQAEQYIEKKYGKEYIRNDIEKLETNQGKSGQEAHEAIRCTTISTIHLPDTFSPQEKKMYSIIWTQTVESCMMSARGLKLVATITAPNNNEFYYESELISFMGWMMVQNKPIETYYIYLLNIKEGEIKYEKIIASQVMKGGKTHFSEAQLIQALEKKNIGRPSTFSSIVEKIKTKQYVKKMDVQGKKMLCKQFELMNDNITIKEEEKTFQSEKNKLVIQSKGKEVIQFCYTYFEPLFNYNYSEKMECMLDKIVTNDILWYMICKECYDLIQESIKTINISPNKKNHTKHIGIYKDKELIVKKGRFGYYADWGGAKTSLNHLGDININDLTLDILSNYLEKKDTNIVRKLNAELSIRKSKYGNYIFYKTPKMKKPTFYKLDKFKDDPTTCNVDALINWIFTEYKI